MVNNRLTWFLESNNLLTNIQGGFRKNRSTIVRLESFIRDGFINNQHVVSVFFDLEKAYDTTWKYGILNDLHSKAVTLRFVWGPPSLIQLIRRWVSPMVPYYL
jgi:hypothetical protein